MKESLLNIVRHIFSHHDIFCCEKISKEYNLPIRYRSIVFPYLEIKIKDKIFKINPSLIKMGKGDNYVIREFTCISSFSTPEIPSLQITTRPPMTQLGTTKLLTGDDEFDRVFSVYSGTEEYVQYYKRIIDEEFRKSLLSMVKDQKYPRFDILFEKSYFNLDISWVNLDKAPTYGQFHEFLMCVLQKF